MKCHEWVEESFEVCWNCGTSREGIEDPNFRPEVEGELVARTTYPVSKVCPRCGCAEYTTCRPAGFIAFVKDRVCKSCTTRYTPPTPVWAAILLIGIGLPLAAFMALSIMVRLAAMVRVPATSSVLWAGMVSDGFFAFIGARATVHGIRALRRATSTNCGT